MVTEASDASEVSLANEVVPGRTGASRKLWLLWALLGPGIISLMAGNDAGGMVSYTMTGATFGISFFLPLLFLLAPVGYAFQEMSLRLSAVTQTEYRALVLERFGPAWSWLSVAALFIANQLYIIAEFMGMTTGLTLVGFPLWLADMMSFLFVGVISLLQGYLPKERLALFVGALNVAFVGVAVMAHPSPDRVAQAFTTWPHIVASLGGKRLLIFAMATIGNTVAPFMLYFQNSATLDKGLAAEDLRLGRIDIALGAVLQPFFAATVMIAGAALVGRVAHADSASPATLIRAFVPVIGHWGGTLYAIGLFNAGWLASVTVSLSSAYTVAGAFGWPRTLNRKPFEARGFYGIYFGSLLIGALIILIPRLPLDMIAVYTQIIAATLLVPDLILLVVLTSNRTLMGVWVSSLISRIANWGIVMLFLAISITMLFMALT